MMTTTASWVGLLVGVSITITVTATTTEITGSQPANWAPPLPKGWHYASSHQRRSIRTQENRYMWLREHRILQDSANSSSCSIYRTRVHGGRVVDYPITNVQRAESSVWCCMSSRAKRPPHTEKLPLGWYNSHQGTVRRWLKDAVCKQEAKYRPR